MTAIVGVVALLAGCAHVVEGTAHPAVKALQVLPTDDEISAAVGNTLSNYGFQPFVGGPEILPDGFRTDAEASPIACIGVTDTTMRVVYEATPMVEAARQSYFTLDQHVAVTGRSWATGSLLGSALAAFARWRACMEREPSKFDDHRDDG